MHLCTNQFFDDLIFIYDNFRPVDVFITCQMCSDAGCKVANFNFTGKHKGSEMEKKT